MNQTLAQGLMIRPPGSAGAGVTIRGPLVGIEKLSDLVALIVSFLIPLAGVILFLIIMWGGYDILMSQGNADSVQTGKQKITAGIIGFVLLIISYFLANLLGYIFLPGEGSI